MLWCESTKGWGLNALGENIIQCEKINKAQVKFNFEFIHCFLLNLLSQIESGQVFKYQVLK
jgi:hypothetical protein